MSTQGPSASPASAVARSRGRTLNLACGTKAVPGAVNMDLLPLPGVDVVHNALRVPWPFPDGSFDEIVTEHFFEHIPHHHESGKDGFIVVMEECHRVLAPGGVLRVSVPHHRRWRENLRDPTHTRIIHPEVWRYFAPDAAKGSGDKTPNFYTWARFELVDLQHTGWRARPTRPFPYLAYRFPGLKKYTSKPTETTFVLARRDAAPH